MINLITKYDYKHELVLDNIFILDNVYLNFDLINKYPNKYFIVTDSNILFKKCLVNLLNIDNYIYKIKINTNDSYYFFKSPINNQKIVNINNIFEYELFEPKIIIENIFGTSVKKRTNISTLKNTIYMGNTIFNNERNWECLFPQNIITSKKDITCDLISFYSIITSSDIYKLNFNTNIVNGYDFSLLKQGSTIYICASAIPHFIQTIAPQISFGYILITGDDESVPTDLFNSNDDFINFIESSNLIHWFSQNCVLTSHPKLSQIPIGLDYHTIAERDHEWGNKTTPLNQEKLLQTIASKAKPLDERICKAYGNFQFAMTTKFSSDRVDAINQVPKDLVFYEPTKIKRLNTWVSQSKYAFVISPHGNGLDCHRTWEALALGCIPIVKTSPLDSLYNDLPILIVKEWSDVTQELLNKTIEEYKNKQFNLEKLKLNYWIEKINSYKS